MNGFFSVVDWRGWIADRSSLLIWFVFVASVVFALFDLQKLKEEIRTSTGNGKRVARFKLFLVLSLPIITFIAAEASQWGSDKADREIMSLKTELKQSNATLTNASQEAHTAINKVTALEPRKQPIMSVVANAHFRMRGINNVINWNYNDPGAIMMGVARLQCGRSSEVRSCGWKIMLMADRFSSAGGEGEADFWMDFHPEPDFPMFNVRSNTAGIVDELDVIELNAIMLMAATNHGFNPEILDGNVTLTINSTIRKNFPIPPQKPFMPIITCLVTNGYVSTFDVGQGGHGSVIPYPTNRIPYLPDVDGTSRF